MINDLICLWKEISYCRIWWVFLWINYIYSEINVLWIFRL